MKPVGMPWGHFLKKQYELWPLLIATGFGMCLTTFASIRSAFVTDYILIRGKYPWDRKDLLRHPYHRKILHFNQEYTELPELDCLYKEMDKAERELHRRQKEKAVVCDD